MLSISHKPTLYYPQMTQRSYFIPHCWDDDPIIRPPPLCTSENQNSFMVAAAASWAAERTANPAADPSTSPEEWSAPLSSSTGPMAATSESRIAVVVDKVGCCGNDCEVWGWDVDAVGEVLFSWAIRTCSRRLYLFLNFLLHRLHRFGSWFVCWVRMCRQRLTDVMTSLQIWH